MRMKISGAFRIFQADLGLATLRKTLPPAKGPALQPKSPSSGTLLRLIK